MNLSVYGNLLGVLMTCNLLYDVMNHVDCVTKRDVYPQKKHSCSKNIRGVSVLF